MTFSREQVLSLLGGKWPEANGFCWDTVEYFVLEEDRLVPMDSGGETPGSDLMVTIRLDM